MTIDVKDAAGATQNVNTINDLLASQTPLGRATLAASQPVAIANDQGSLICDLADIVAGTASDTAGTSTEVLAAAGSGIKIYLTRVSLSNTHASTGVMVALKSATTSRYRVYVPPGGREIAFEPPLPPNAANEAWNFDPDSAVTTIECSMVGFTSVL